VANGVSQFGDRLEGVDRFLPTSEFGMFLRVAQEVSSDVDPALPGLRSGDFLARAKPPALCHASSRVSCAHGFFEVGISDFSALFNGELGGSASSPRPVDLNPIIDFLDCNKLALAPFGRFPESLPIHYDQNIQSVGKNRPLLFSSGFRPPPCLSLKSQFPRSLHAPSDNGLF
jgi:hypothetical protein